MALHVLGINHQTAPVSLRERVAFAPESLAPALASLRALPEVHEAVLLSTCNRTELYAHSDDDGQALAGWLSAHPEAGGELGAYLYRHRDADAVRHLFRVATGLDSLVLGEPQILGQVKQAWSAAREAGALGGQLDRLFQQAFATAKRARTDTRIGANPVSVASTAVRLAQESFARLDESTVLLIGAGETIELAARHLVEAKVQRLLIANRTLAHAQELASRHGGIALPLSELDQHLAEADIVLSATASRDADPASRAGRARAAAAPASADAAARPGGAARHRQRRVRPARRVPVHRRRPRARGRGQPPRSPRGRRPGRGHHRAADRALRRELAGQRAASSRCCACARMAKPRATKRWRRRGSNSPPACPAEQALDLLAHTLTNRLLHAPTVALREAALSGDGDLARAAEKLFPAASTDDTGA